MLLKLTAGTQRYRQERISTGAALCDPLLIRHIVMGELLLFFSLLLLALIVLNAPWF